MNQLATTLLKYNITLLDQALDLISQCEQRPGIAIGDTVGPHLRHVINHYEAVVMRSGYAVDYDSRHRDTNLERSPAELKNRIVGIQNSLIKLQLNPLESLDQRLTVIAQVGVQGECSLQSISSLGRELVFLSSHTVHHFAILKPVLANHGLVLGQNFGKAASTAAYEVASINANINLNPEHHSISVMENPS